MPDSDLIERMAAEGKLPTIKEELEKGEQPSSLAPTTAFVPPVLEEYPTALPSPGIHFGVPEEVYHAWPALSCSGIRKLAASPTLFYMLTPWLNAGHEPREEPEWANVGKAYHARILEGREAFNERFCIKLEKSAVPDLCTTVDEIKARIETHDVKPVGKKKEDFVAQLLELEPDAPIWEECQRRYAEEQAGRCQLAYDVIERIEIAAAMIERHEELSKAFSGGHAEVSLFWYCPQTGVPMKARVDYLKLAVMVDLKSYENKLELSPEYAIPKAIANNRYPLQPSVYLEAAREVKALVREHGDGAIWTHFPGGLAALDIERHKANIEWALKWAAKETEPQWLWVFQQKGIAPITRGIFYPTGGTVRMLFDEIVSRSKKRFRQFSETFGTDTWLDIAPINDTFADEDIAPWAADI